MVSHEKMESLIQESNYISRDLSWIAFNYRVLDQAKSLRRSIIDRLKFIAITASNLDEFFMIRVGSLYNYIDYSKERFDYSGLREGPFRVMLFDSIRAFEQEQTRYFEEELRPLFPQSGFRIVGLEELDRNERKQASNYFRRMIFPMLTPMMYDSYHAFPILRNQLPVFGIVTRSSDEKSARKLSFIQIPKNIPRFFEVERDDELLFVSIEDIIRDHLDLLFRNVEILNVSLFRITRNGDYTLEESDDLEADFIHEIKDKVKSRKTGRVVRIEIEKGYSRWMMRILKNRWEVDDNNIFETSSIIDYTCLWELIKHPDLSQYANKFPSQISPEGIPSDSDEDIFTLIKKGDIFLHHPYNSFEPVLRLVEEAAEDPDVLSIKMTIYRLAKKSRITRALNRAVENGKHVSVLFELKARFDEENNIVESQNLLKAGCFIVYGVNNLKTHTKLLLVVRKEENKVEQYVHMSSGNYNEDTSKLYTDIGILSCKEEYANDISDFFNAITGHSHPDAYSHLITAPVHMRDSLISLIAKEAEHAQDGKPSGIVIKINSLQDQALIDALYEAAKVGVTIQLIVRGICCLRPGRLGLSENIHVCSIVGDFLEHSRLFYFHNLGDPILYGGSADAMVRSFDRRIESLFMIIDEKCKKEAIRVLRYNLLDNVNSYQLNEDGTYSKKISENNDIINIHQHFYNEESSPDAFSLHSFLNV